MKPMHEEYHITVEGDPILWVGCCHQLKLKPLWIELNNFERQLMCAAKPMRANALELGEQISEWRIFGHRPFTVVRVKDEIQPYTLDVSTYDKPHQYLLEPAHALYYECHVKFDGPFRPSWHMASRDLLRESRWYVTRRQLEPFDPAPWVAVVTGWAQVPDGRIGPSVFAGFEYEAAVLDTNPNLDSNWKSR